MLDIYIAMPVWCVMFRPDSNSTEVDVEIITDSNESRIGPSCLHFPFKCEIGSTILSIGQGKGKEELWFILKVYPIRLKKQPPCLSVCM